MRWIHSARRVGFFRDRLRQLACGIIIAALCLTPLSAGIKQWRAYTKAAKKAFKEGDHSGAEKMFLAALQETETLGLKDRHLAKTLLHLASLYHPASQDSPDWKLRHRAEWTHGWARRVAQRSLPASHPDVRIVLNNLADLCRLRRAPKLSEKIYQRALAIYERTKGKGSAGTVRSSEMNAASSLQGLAKLYHDERQYAQAEKYYVLAVAAWEPMMPDIRYEVAKNLYSLAYVYEHQGKYAEAEQAWLRCIPIWEESGRPSPTLIASLVSYAALLRKANRPDEAQALENRAAALQEELDRQSKD